MFKPWHVDTITIIAFIIISLQTPSGLKWTNVVFEDRYGSFMWECNISESHSNITIHCGNYSPCLCWAHEDLREQRWRCRYKNGELPLPQAELFHLRSLVKHHRQRKDDNPKDSEKTDVKLLPCSFSICGQNASSTCSVWERSR